MSDERNTLFGTIITFLTGAAIGAGLALLFAPQSGEETRKKIKDFSDKVTDDVKEGYEKVTKEAQKAVDNVKTTSEKTLAQIKNFFENAKESLKKELKKEIAEEKEISKKKPAVKA